MKPRAFALNQSHLRSVPGTLISALHVLISSSQYPFDVNTMLAPTAQMRKPKLKKKKDSNVLPKVTKLARSQDLNQNGQAPKNVPLSTGLSYSMGNQMEWKQTKDSLFIPPSSTLLPTSFSAPSTFLFLFFSLHLSLTLLVFLFPLFHVSTLLLWPQASLFFLYAQCCPFAPNSFYLLLVPTPLHL